MDFSCFRQNISGGQCFRFKHYLSPRVRKSPPRKHSFNRFRTGRKGPDMFPVLILQFQANLFRFFGAILLDFYSCLIYGALPKLDWYESAKNPAFSRLPGLRPGECRRRRSVRTGYARGRSGLSPRTCASGGWNCQVQYADYHAFGGGLPGRFGVRFLPLDFLRTTACSFAATRNRHLRTPKIR